MQTRAGGPNLIDISHYQTVSDWHAVANAQIYGVYIKATEGTTFTDPAAANHAQGAKGAGIKVGYYHFARPSGDAKEDATHFVQVVQQLPAPDLRCVLDLEDAGGRNTTALAKWITDFDAVVFAQLKHHIILYSYTNFMQTHLPASFAPSGIPLWIADYRGLAAPPNVCGYKTYVLYQYSSNGSIPGIAGRVDIDALPAGGSINDLLIQPQPKASAPPTMNEQLEVTSAMTAIVCYGPLDADLALTYVAPRLKAPVFLRNNDGYKAFSSLIVIGGPNDIPAPANGNIQVLTGNTYFDTVAKVKAFLGA